MNNAHPCKKRKGGATSLWVGPAKNRAPLTLGLRSRPELVKLPSILLKFLGLFLVAATVAASPVPDVHAIAQAVDDRYNHLHTLQSEFTELYRGAGAERTESGTLWLKKPGKMRREYRSPHEKLSWRKGTMDDYICW